MKKVLVLLMLGMLVMTGCTTLPSGVKASLYTAQSSLQHTATDARAAKKPEWNIPNGATDPEIMGRLREQNEVLIRIMEQANKNLQAVVHYFRTGQEVE